MSDEAQAFDSPFIAAIKAQLAEVERTRIASNRGEPYDDYVRAQHQLFRMFNPSHSGRHEVAVSALLSEVERLAHAQAEATAAEREACASIADKHLRTLGMLAVNPGRSEAAWRIGNEIRARAAIDISNKTAE